MGILSNIQLHWSFMFFHGPLHFKIGFLQFKEKPALRNLDLGWHRPKFIRGVEKSEKK